MVTLVEEVDHKKNEEDGHAYTNANAGFGAIRKRFLRWQY